MEGAVLAVKSGLEDQRVTDVLRCGALVGNGPGQVELLTQVGWEPAGGDGVVPARWADAGADAGKDGFAEGTGGGVDGELPVVRGKHTGGVLGERAQVWRERGRWDAEEGGHAMR